MNIRIWSGEIMTLGDRIIALPVGQAGELSRYLKEVHGIQVVEVPHPPPLPPDEGDAPEAYDVCMDGYDAFRKLGLIRLVRELTGLGVKDARDMVEKKYSLVKERLPPPEAVALKARLEAAGARVVLRECAA